MARVLTSGTVALGAMLPSSAIAGPLEECLPAGDHAAVTRCLIDEDVKVTAELSCRIEQNRRRVRDLRP